MSGIFHGKNKAVTFSFDDGVWDDIRLVALMNKYGLKGTFNLNSGLMTSAGSWRFNDTKDVIRINYFDYPDLYAGHEIASHTYTHPNLTRLDMKTIDNEIKMDIRLLGDLYHQKIEGFAYPFGAYDSNIISVLKQNGLEYGRTTKSTYSFDLPEEPLTWHPTCKFNDPRLERLVQEFIALESGPALFYIWGHSYELVTEEDWAQFEKICRDLSGRDDVCYATNIDVIKGLNRVWP